FLALLFKEADLKEPTENIRICRDPKDDKYLELAVSGSANFLISGDKDLLDLHPFKEIRILTPEQFLSLDLE
ncbi:MAG: putative toxin-antitoxin system toxin component, PIN family, partial [Candidatus Thorarchaeota archaeon]|nr:putative toxin-antitoxin system toxin component, PIN family [Candidatus Thorarchaeota archaeon]